MLLSTSLAVGTVLLTSLYFTRKTQEINIFPRRRRLIDQLKPATLQSSEVSDEKNDTWQIMPRLFADTRQKQQYILNASYDVSEDQKAEKVRQRNLIISSFGFGFATIGLFGIPILNIPSVLLTIYASRFLVRDAYYYSIKERRLDYRVILAFSTVTALLGGFVWAGSFGIFFASINWYLVAKTESRSKRSIIDLFGGQIRTVYIFVDGVELEISFTEVKVGDIVVVDAGQMIPVDGTITMGTATIDQHILTGESQPVEMGIGDSVLASTIMLSGRLHIHVDKAGDATVAAQVTDMLSQTTDFKQTLESRTERWLNKMASPLIGLSVVSLPLVGGEGALAILWHYPGFRMTLFGPISMLSYLQVAAKRGILIKDGRALEELRDVDTVVFDKTGTLTLEQPTVRRVCCYNGLTESDLLRYTAAAESKQSHPIAYAIMQTAADSGLELPILEDAEYKAGYGLKVRIEGHAVHVGSIRFMSMENITVPQAIMSQQAQIHAQGHLLILVAVDDELAGAIELQPTVRPEAQEIIQYLHSREVKMVIISGDHDAPTRRLAMNLGIDHYFSEVLPEDKANLVAQLRSEKRKVCFIGDGINDSVALKTADVAVSLRGATTAATDIAEIIFMDGTLRQLPNLFELADEFAANMHINMLAAMLPGIIGIAGTLLFGWGMTFGVILMQSSTPVGLYNSIKPLLDEKGSSSMN